MSRHRCRFLLVALSALTLAACGSGATTSSTGVASSTSTATTSAAATSSSQPALGFEGVPLQAGPQLAPASSTGTAPVDGIKCAPVEQLAYHIHAHLAVFVDGRLDALPGGVGIPGSVVQQSQEGPIAAGGHCYYWLHTHTSDGVIHIESPTQRIYTLGNFFDEWRQPLSSTQVGGVHGTITAYLNGKLWKRSPRAIPLLPHADIQFDIGEPAPPLLSVNWTQTRL